MKTRKLQKHGRPGNLFTRAISKVLDAREAELENGRGIKIKDVIELRKRLRLKRSKAVA